MGVFNLRCLGLAAMVMLITGVIVSNHQVVAQGCQANIPGLVGSCAQYVQIPGGWVPPSAICCAFIQGLDTGCACQSITWEVERTISMPKVVSLFRTCGKQLGSGTRCGSKDDGVIGKDWDAPCIQVNRIKNCNLKRNN
ncbi:hypothetical protein GIB67_007226 [Kingdonia uniflora]|uniref:Bifunctional inhibitor/plant lipid transfer protein/seed storage helical domain-containing protein n=1 Tax=Kingdonia uniflora TaxID=39325 RepID=A0A7J7NWY0_9MAGN|nr:hypothetical protein GIB67_007226 [Kingdonia uniflora]